MPRHSKFTSVNKAKSEILNLIKGNAEKKLALEFKEWLVILWHRV